MYVCLTKKMWTYKMLSIQEKLEGKSPTYEHGQKTS